MKYYIYILILCLSQVIFSCDRSERIIPIEETDVPVEIDLVTPSVRGLSDNTTDPDYVINSVRIMAYHSGTKLLKYDSGKKDLTKVTQPIKLEMWTGTYDFVFIANEHSSGSMNLTILLDMLSMKQYTPSSSLSLLDEKYFPSYAFYETIDIPATSIYRNVRILGDNTHLTYTDPFTNMTSTIGGSPGSIWEVFVERLATRVDLSLKIDAAFINQLSSVNFVNVPSSVYLFDRYFADNSIIYCDDFSTSYYYSRHDISEFTVTGPDADNMYTYTKERIILPASVFSPESDKAKAITIEVPLSNTTMKGVIGHNISNNDYTSPRNTYYKITGKLEKNSLELDVLANEWNAENISGNTGEKKLNVDCLTASMSLGDVLRIHFWSNQPSVYIDEIGYFDADCNYEYNIDDIFNNLCGENAANLTYDPTTGSGYVDLIFKSGITNSHIRDGELRFYVNASGLRREIIISIN